MSSVRHVLQLFIRDVINYCAIWNEIKSWGRSLLLPQHGRICKDMVAVCIPCVHLDPGWINDLFQQVLHNYLETEWLKYSFSFSHLVPSVICKTDTKYHRCYFLHNLNRSAWRHRSCVATGWKQTSIQRWPHCTSSGQCCHTGSICASFHATCVTSSVPASQVRLPPSAMGQ